ncbi:hypothetical protein ACLMJK_005426 [Lecanora helva]
MVSVATRCGRLSGIHTTKESVIRRSYSALHNGQSAPSYYWETVGPTADQLKYAGRFFWQAPPQLLFSSTTFRHVQMTDLPEVAFLGRSNVGKSSLLNALMGRKICHVSSKPGRTRSMNFFAVGGEDSAGNPGKLAVLDMPGYGKGSREEWGPEIMKYLIGRRQLRRAFLLVDPLHGLKRSDEEILSLFRQNAISHQVILPKIDRVLAKKPRSLPDGMESSVQWLDAIVTKLRPIIQPGKGDGPDALGEIVTCSSEKTVQGTKIGIDNVRWAVLAATGLGR